MAVTAKRCELLHQFRPVSLDVNKECGYHPKSLHNDAHNGALFFDYGCYLDQNSVLDSLALALCEHTSGQDFQTRP